MKFIPIIYHPCINSTRSQSSILLLLLFFLFLFANAIINSPFLKLEEKYSGGFNKRKKNPKLHTLRPRGLAKNEMIKIKKFVIFFQSSKSEIPRKSKKKLFLTKKKGKEKLFSSTVILFFQKKNPTFFDECK